MVNIVNVGFDYSRLIVYTRLCEQKKKNPFYYTTLHETSHSHKVMK